MINRKNERKQVGYYTNLSDDLYQQYIYPGLTLTELLGLFRVNKEFLKQGQEFLSQHWPETNHYFYLVGHPIPIAERQYYTFQNIQVSENTIKEAFPTKSSMIKLFTQEKEAYLYARYTRKIETRTLYQGPVFKTLWIDAKKTPPPEQKLDVSIQLHNSGTPYLLAPQKTRRQLTCHYHEAPIQSVIPLSAQLTVDLLDRDRYHVHGLAHYERPVKLARKPSGGRSL